jgi:hypothetical protein
MSQTDPNQPAPQEEPTHDVPVYPEQDPPPGHETSPIMASGEPGPFGADPSICGAGSRVSRDPREGDEGGPPHPGTPSKGKDEGHDVDEDDLDPKSPHSPPDVGRRKVIFDENEVVS